MLQWVMIAIGSLTLLVSCWVLYEAWRGRKLGEAQLVLSTEPDLKLHVDGPNSDPISINCRNWGARVTEMKLSIEDQSEELNPYPHELFDEYFLRIPKRLTEGKSELKIKLSYRDKLSKITDKLFIYDTNTKRILPK